MIRFQEDIYLLLQWLKKGKTHLSGEELSSKLKLTRSALWKKINFLRELGYNIDGQRSRGYMLIDTPDIPYPWEIDLEKSSLWKELIYFKEIGSTNTFAYSLAEEGAKEGTVLIAERQTGGRGRLGRQWHSPPKGNVYMSLILRPKIPPYFAPQFTLAAGVGVADSIRKVSGVTPEIKWPNDILLGRKKLSGILTELKSEMDRVSFIIVGIGVNLNSGLDDYPEQLRDQITTLMAFTGKRFNRNQFIKVLLDCLEGVFNLLLKAGFGAIKKRWEEYFCMKGEDVIISFERGILRGKALGIDESGAFLLRRMDGNVERVLSGDINFLRSI